MCQKLHPTGQIQVDPPCNHVLAHVKHGSLFIVSYYLFLTAPILDLTKKKSNLHFRDSSWDLESLHIIALSNATLL